MRTVLKSMQMEKYGIPKGVISKFEHIIEKYYVPNKVMKAKNNEIFLAI